MAMSTKARAKSILRRALALLEKKGWGQHSFFNEETGTYCMLGAINKAAFKNPYGDTSLAARSPEELVAEAAEDAVIESLPTRYRSIIEFNDSRKRKYSQVKAVLEAAITALSIKENA